MVLPVSFHMTELGPIETGAGMTKAVSWYKSVKHMFLYFLARFGRYFVVFVVVV